MYHTTVYQEKLMQNIREIHWKAIEQLQIMSNKKNHSNSLHVIIFENNEHKEYLRKDVLSYISKLPEGTHVMAIGYGTSVKLIVPKVDITSESIKYINDVMRYTYYDHYNKINVDDLVTSVKDHGNYEEFNFSSLDNYTEKTIQVFS